MKTKTAAALGGLVLAAGLLAACTSSSSAPAGSPTGAPTSTSASSLSTAELAMCTALEKVAADVVPDLERASELVKSDPAAAASLVDKIRERFISGQEDADSGLTPDYATAMDGYAVDIRALPAGADATKISQELAERGVAFASDVAYFCKE